MSPSDFSNEEEVRRLALPSARDRAQQGHQRVDGVPRPTQALSLPSLQSLGLLPVASDIALNGNRRTIQTMNQPAMIQQAPLVHPIRPAPNYRTPHAANVGSLRGSVNGGRTRGAPQISSSVVTPAAHNRTSHADDPLPQRRSLPVPAHHQQPATRRGPATSLGAASHASAAPVTLTYMPIQVPSADFREAPLPKRRKAVRYPATINGRQPRPSGADRKNGRKDGGDGKDTGGGWGSRASV